MAKAIKISSDKRGYKTTRINSDILVVYGLPLFFWMSMLILPNQGHIFAMITVGLQFTYFLRKPTVERSGWFLLSYLFSLGGNRVVLGTGSVPIFFNLLSYLVIPWVVLRVLLSKKMKYGHSLIKPLLILLFFSFMSALWHTEGLISLLDWIGWVLHFLRYPFWFLALINTNIPTSIYRAWIRHFIGLSVLQIPSTIIMFLSGIPSGDGLLGTMYGAQTGLMGLTIVVAFCAGFAESLFRRLSTYKKILLFLLFIPPLLGGAGFSLLLLTVLFIYLMVLRLKIGLTQNLWPERRRFIMRINLFLITTLLLFSLLFSSIKLGFGEVILLGGVDEFADLLNGRTTSLSSIKSFTDPHYAPYHSRQKFIATVARWFYYNPHDLLLGSLGPHFGYGEQGQIFARLIGIEAPDVLSKVNLAVGLPASLRQNSVQLPRILLELGLVGLFCFWLLFRQVRQVGQAVLQLPEVDPWVRGQALGFKGIWLLYVVLSVFYIDVWRLDHSSFPFWLWAAMLYNARVSQQS